MQSELVVGASYIKVHKVNGHHATPRRFLGVSEGGYVQFAGAEAGQIMSESPSCWSFYKVGDAALPAPVTVPAGWVEGAGGFYDPVAAAAERKRFEERFAALAPAAPAVEDAPVADEAPAAPPAAPAVEDAPAPAADEAPAPAADEAPAAPAAPAAEDAPAPTQ